ncbi:hypothetical protein [Nitrospira sp. BLG_1]
MEKVEVGHVQFVWGMVQGLAMGRVDWVLALRVVCSDGEAGGMRG